MLFQAEQLPPQSIALSQHPATVRSMQQREVVDQPHGAIMILTVGDLVQLTTVEAQRLTRVCAAIFCQQAVLELNASG